MPVYNAQRYLREAIDSALAQTFTDFEIIISDNASTDATADICAEYARRDSRIKYHRQSQNRGVVANFNTVFQLSSGEYFKWAAYDDLQAPAYIARCVETLDRDAQVVVAHSLTRSINEFGADVGEFPCLYPLDDPHAPERYRRMIWTDTFPPIWGLMRSSAIRKTRLHGAYMGSDRTFMAEMMLHGRAHYHPENLFFLREHPGSYTSSVKDYYQRLSWYAPGRNIPSWMQLPITIKGFAGAIRRSPACWSDKMACTRHLSSFVVRCYTQWIKRKLGMEAEPVAQTALV